MRHKNWLSEEDFTLIYSNVPRLNVDLVICNESGGVVLIKRSVLPSIGSWHLPGGTVYKTERVEDAAKRIAMNETGFEIRVIKSLGYMEFPHEERELFEMHSVSIVLLVEVCGGVMKSDENAEGIGIFKESLPEPCLQGYDTFLIDYGFFK